MPWTIQLLSHHGGSVAAQRSDAVPDGVTGDLVWSLNRYGNCLHGSFTADVTRFPVRGTQPVQIRVNGQPWFFGFVAEAPNMRDPTWGEVKLDGASRLLEKRRLKIDMFRDMDVGAVARALVQTYGHPALLYDPALIPDLGVKIGQFSLPYRTLAEALDALGKTVSGTEGLPFGVLPDRRVFFGAPAGAAPALPYNEAEGLRWLRVTTDDVVTRAYLIALSRTSGVEPSRVQVFPPNGQLGAERTSTTGVPYRPTTYASMAELEDEAGIGWQDARLAPAGADILGKADMERDQIKLTVEGMTSPDNARDGDLTTASVSDGQRDRAALIYSQAPLLDASPVVGFRVVYSLDLGADLPKYQPLISFQYSAPTGGKAYFDFDLLDTAGKPREVTAVLPLPHVMADGIPLPAFTRTTKTVNDMGIVIGCYGRPQVSPDTGATVYPLVPQGVFQVYEVELLTYDRVKTDTLAQKLLVPPAGVPSEFRVRRLLSPAREYTLVGAPGGDLTGSVAEFEYRHGTGGLTTTTVKLEQPGASETARIIRLSAQRQALDAQAQLRGYLEGP